MPLPRLDDDDNDSYPWQAFRSRYFQPRDRPGPVLNVIAVDTQGTSCESVEHFIRSRFDLSCCAVGMTVVRGRWQFFAAFPNDLVDRFMRPVCILDPKRFGERVAKYQDRGLTYMPQLFPSSLKRKASSEPTTTDDDEEAASAGKC